MATPTVRTNSSSSSTISLPSLNSDSRSFSNRSRSSSAVTTPVSSAGSPPACGSGVGAGSTPNPSGSHVSQPPHVAIRPAAPLPPPKLALSPTATSTSSISAAPPPNLNKMAMASVVSPTPIEDMPTPKAMSMTTKEWVLPPRPRPGRKPATDTPPTKRKAQNRAAQRAFRERRAARVGELEEQIEEQKEEHDKSERDLQDRIRVLELEVREFRSRCGLLEGLLQREQRERVSAEAEVKSLRRRWNEEQSQPAGQHVRTASLPSFPQNDASLSTSASLSPLPGSGTGVFTPMGTDVRPTTSKQPFSISQIISPPDPTEIDVSADPTSMTCGNCEPDRCPCAEEALAQVISSCTKCGIGGTCQCFEATLKRPLEPESLEMPEEKRRRQEPEATPQAMETDFTSMFSKKPAASSSSSSTQSASMAFLPAPTPQPVGAAAQVPPKDRCGFCKDGDYCICGDTSVSLTAATPLVSGTYAPTPMYSGPQTQTPPPSENDVIHTAYEVMPNGAVKLPSPGASRHSRQTPAEPTRSRSPPRRGSSGGCGPNGPGTCAQCQSDPKSGLFCRSLAANFERQRTASERSASGGGCCGGGGADGGCCKGPNGPPGSAKAKTESLGLAVGCAEAYKTLASHKYFDKAEDEIGTWLPKLKALPRIEEEEEIKPQRSQAYAGRELHPLEVEAASIMSVLKDFNVRFGK